ncbi:cupin domain-containing protein [Paraburkholderia sp. Ac-20340]|uniref:cupin domain-containing protein n=1 Tax=Paraburkholderia sp. Ac-20340 TaxID=2703888 RepID=UPI00198239F6|nr:cupin domain-containing protein [Paraburkholderia sp. Ac-20340]MBN3854006.1 cupin domain-containing protein [Paraburkholderia sp. Ac-20340]
MSAVEQQAVQAGVEEEARAGGKYMVVTPETEESYWQPQPANGHASVHVAPHLVPMDRPFSAGTQTLPPGGVVRKHSHDANEEVLHFISGSGKAVLDGTEYRLGAGTTLFLGKLRTHTFINDGDTDLHWAWFFVPSGLENFFRDIGRERKPGDATPEPFGRPENVAEIEARTVFATGAGQK